MMYVGLEKDIPVEYVVMKEENLQEQQPKEHEKVLE
jgi:hypothetical protein